ncbi:MAG: hypothetical protein KKB91_10130 [Proteobacteria bacterium]|nr:hypothetical protein [Pseudomonadota bacterium]MCG2744953.1 hypothetical protein [Desulfobacteraceae bacterium]MDO8948381.1 hypothetical protein [Desulfocapsaceae bacterium]MBU3982743.1 hypothetical protein [Pseudomonadota bacterium]MBU4027965.1 hypothetical protein [Pseudomonadota bacterium]
MTRPLMSSALAFALFLFAGSVLAAVPTPVRENAQIDQQEHIYGYQLMTPQERIEYRVKIRDAKNNEERKRIRKKHHSIMTIRAKARGVILPAEPPVRGGNMGVGGGRAR